MRRDGEGGGEARNVEQLLLREEERKEEEQDKRGRGGKGKRKRNKLSISKEGRQRRWG